MQLRFRFTLLSLILFTFGFTAQAQQLETRPPSTGLILEITYVKGLKPAFQAVSWTNSKKGGSWYGRFESIGKVASDEQRVQAVRIVPFVEGTGVRVNVSVLRGKFLDLEDNVGNYLMNEGEKLTVEELRSVGVAPFELRLFRVDPSTGNAPSFVNKTKSVEVVSLEPLPSTLPAYKVTVHNSSSRNISALRIEVLSGGRLSISSLPQGVEGKALVPAGGYGTFQTRVPVNAEPRAGGSNPVAKVEHQIVIKSLVFDDGSYEGDAESAAMFRSLVLGGKLELRRINPVLSSAVERTASVTDFISQIKALTYDLSEADLAGLTKQFPKIPAASLADAVQTAMHGTRSDLLDQASRFAAQSEPDKGQFQAWLIDTKARYDAWFSRL